MLVTFKPVRTVLFFNVEPFPDQSFPRLLVVSKFFLYLSSRFSELRAEVNYYPVNLKAIMRGQSHSVYTCKFTYLRSGECIECNR